ncbi:10210_t:CDS:2, partial [Ambispora gerdemannii]
MDALLPQRFTVPGKGALPLKWMDALPQRFTASSKGVLPRNGWMHYRKGRGGYTTTEVIARVKECYHESGYTTTTEITVPEEETSKKRKLKKQLAKNLSLSVNSTSKKEVWIYYHK